MLFSKSTGTQNQRLQLTLINISPLHRLQRISHQVFLKMHMDQIMFLKTLSKERRKDQNRKVFRKCSAQPKILCQTNWSNRTLKTVSFNIKLLFSSNYITLGVIKLHQFKILNLIPGIKCKFSYSQQTRCHSTQVIPQHQRSKCLWVQLVINNMELFNAKCHKISTWCRTTTASHCPQEMRNMLIISIARTRPLIELNSLPSVKNNDDFYFAPQVILLWASERRR